MQFRELIIEFIPLEKDARERLHVNHVSVQFTNSYSKFLRALTSDFRQNGTGNLTSTTSERQSKRNALEECLLLIVVQGMFLPLHNAAVYVRGTPVLGIPTNRKSSYAQQIF